MMHNIGLEGRLGVSLCQMDILVLAENLIISGI